MDDRDYKGLGWEGMCESEHCDHSSQVFILMGGAGLTKLLQHMNID